MSPLGNFVIFIYNGQAHIIKTNSQLHAVRPLLLETHGRSLTEWSLNGSL